MRKIARRILENEQEKDPPACRVGSDLVVELLGVPRFHRPTMERRDQVGLAWGLAVTRHGGELLAVEVAVVPGKGKLMLTGKLGDVMQESAQAAVSYVRSRASMLGIDPAFHTSNDIHIHCPEGAVPKDGPSAGITIVSCLVSALLKAPISHRVAMTGEITLRGRVMPIGGVKDKILAAAREHIPNVILPRENRNDLKEIPRHALTGMSIVIVDHVDEVLREVLVHERIEELFPSRGTVIEYAKEQPAAGDGDEVAEEVGWELGPGR
jgi:ATP-dependent Lon protease